MKYQKEYMESIKKIEEQLVGDQRKHDSDSATVAHNDSYSNGEVSSSSSP